MFCSLGFDSADTKSTWRDHVAKLPCLWMSYRFMSRLVTVVALLLSMLFPLLLLKKTPKTVPPSAKSWDPATGWYRGEGVANVLAAATVRQHW